MHCYFVVVVKDWSVDQETNNVSLFHVVEELQVTSDAALILQELSIVSLWEVDSPAEVGTTFEACFDLMDASSAVMKNRLQSEFTVSHPRTRVRVPSIAVHGAGKFSIVARHRAKGSSGDWTEGARWRIEVKVTAPD